MHSMARQLMAMFESFEHLDLDESPNVRFMDALRAKLNDQIVGTMTIELDGGMIDDEFIDGATTSLARTVLRIHRMFVDKHYWNPAEMTVLMARQFSVRCK